MKSHSAIIDVYLVAGMIIGAVSGMVGIGGGSFLSRLWSTWTRKGQKNTTRNQV